jgi:saccharopine dehydrogenase-like NADP-dependent oxidoreductase
MKKTIFISGAGGIGEAAALLFREWADFDVDIFLGDVNETNLQKAKDFVIKDSSKTTKVESILMDKTGINDAMKSAFESSDCLLDCSPGAQAPRMAQFAKDFGMHYANLTEYVAETDAIIELAKDANTGFILQTGLAPGFINVLAMSLYQEFAAANNVENVERIAMKVGALTAHAHSPHFYGFTWSPIGVATEYVKDSRVIRNAEITELPALSDRETIIIGGRTYEADLTSGGAADLPDYFKSKTKSLDYKTLRHVGHYAYADNVISDCNHNADDVLTRFLNEIPAVEDDFVLVHSSVEGFDDKGTRRMIEKAYFIEPIKVNGHNLRAIQTTTAVPLIESAIMLLSNKYKGVILQSQISPKEFMHGKFVSKIYGIK